MTDQDRARWMKLVGDYDASELTQREFATERGINLSNLRNWAYRLRKESRPLVSEPAKVSGQAPERGAAAEGSRLLSVRVVASAPKARTGWRRRSPARPPELALPAATSTRLQGADPCEATRLLVRSSRRSTSFRSSTGTPPVLHLRSRGLSFVFSYFSTFGGPLNAWDPAAMVHVGRGNTRRLPHDVISAWRDTGP
jgi:hypothetical protein